METTSAKLEAGERPKSEIEVPPELAADFEAATEKQVVRIEEYPDGFFRLVHVYGGDERRGPAELGASEMDSDSDPDDLDEEPLRPLKTPLVYHLYKDELLERYRIVEE